MSKSTIINVEKCIKDNNWNENMLNATLPNWSDFPDIGLYMDQVLFLMEKYIGNIVNDHGKEKFLTPSMINNYVKLNVMPAPENKKYTRIHLAYLIIICLMKQALSISSISNIIKMQLEHNDLETLYSIFCRCYTTTLKNFLESGNLSLRSLPEKSSTNELDISILEMGIISNITRIVTENILSSLNQKKEEAIKEKEAKETKKKDKEKKKEDKK